MRQFLVVGHAAATTSNFSLDDLASGAGRMDLLARSLIDGLLHSHGIRENTRLWLVLSDEVTLQFDGDELRNLHPDERSAAALIRSSLADREEAIGHQPAEPSAGIKLFRWGLSDTLTALSDQGEIHRLTGDGTPMTAVDPPSEPIFILSDHRPFSTEESAEIDEIGGEQLCLGPTALHTPQAITVVHNWLDTHGFKTY